ncbi:MAG TPA: 1-deoxy-D-xylulose-5-phosphate reductoisomerase [Candidatus Hydrogenedentes bacterium]|nr:1-deoxy-D-xylulose-5-phosphate reductoisomerase [Candidatus Hydrogenedentota bacterium]
MSAGGSGRSRIVILGSTGSIGRSALDVVRSYPDRFEVVGLGAGGNDALLAQQLAEFRPAYAAVADSEAAQRLDGRSTELWAGPEGIARLASVEADVVLSAIVGAAGLRPLLSALDAGNRVALANKESLVMAGPLVMEHARRRGVAILPVDSEHNAIFQCLEGHANEDVYRIHLTASGGPFRGRSRASLEGVTPEEATAHPTWSMGPKISIDSATLMNKGLEVIEAMHLFAMPFSRIEVLLHPQSVLHGMVEFNDGSMLAQLSVNDMRFPVLFALTWPERVQCPMKRLDLAAMQELTFGKPDLREFPCLALALRAAEQGGSAPIALNIANEEAVSAFQGRRIRFLDIADVVAETLDTMAVEPVPDFETVWAVAEVARGKARRIIDRRERI